MGADLADKARSRNSWTPKDCPVPVHHEPGNKTPQRDFRGPILLILIAHGGRADRTHMLKQLEIELGNRLTPFDRQDIKSGTIRWQKSAEWEVSTMRQHGLLLPQSESPRGVWCFSPAGERAAKALPHEGGRAS